MKTVVIYCPKITERVKYSFDVLLNRLLGLEVRFVTSVAEWDEVEGPKLFYAPEAQLKENWMWADTLLFENGVHTREIRFQSYQEIPCFFPAPEGAKESMLPFDPFATAFYMLSRYEEYIPAQHDDFGRFRPENSVATKGNFLHLPVVQHWSIFLKKELQKRFPNLLIETPPFRAVATFDIDNAYAYKNKGFIRTVGATLRSLMKNEKAELVGRFHTLLGEKDPYDSYEVIKEIHEAAGIQPVFFWLVGDPGEYDRNIPLKHPAMQRLVKSCSQWTLAGLHPSFSSHERGSLITEKLRLEKVLGSRITKSRFHYLRFRLPDAYEELIAAGITDDYSMGYADRTGFRAGISLPFPFYNLKKEQNTKLLIHPFCAMDATYFYHLKYSAEAAQEDMEQLMERVKETGGDFTLAYHNESMGSKLVWSGWRAAYVQLLEKAVNT